MSRIFATALAACALFVTSTASVELSASPYGNLVQEKGVDVQGHRDDQCRGKDREWGAFHACDCRPGSATYEKSYRDCLDVSCDPPRILPIIDLKPCECFHKPPHKPPNHHADVQMASDEDGADADSEASANADSDDDADASAELDAAGGDDKHHDPKPVPKPKWCKGKKDGFRFEWGAPHFCEPKDDKKCKDGEEGTTYEDCLAVDKYGNQYQTGLTRDVKCKVICNRQKHDDKDCEVPEPPKHKCYGKQHGFRFEWGAPHACVPKDGKKCKVGDKGVTYRDCLAIKKKTGEEFITSLNKEEPCKILSCPKHDHDHDHGHHEVQTLDADAASASGMAEGESSESFGEPKTIPRPDKCEGKKDGFRFEWGAPHFCEPKDDKKCKDGEEGTTYEDCLAVDKYGNQYQTGLTRDVKCKVICNRQKHDDKDCEVPEPPKHKCYGKQHGFRFEWGAPHACVPKDGKKCKVGDKGVTYRDCLAIKKKTGEEFITSLNKEEPCKILSCPKHDHDHDHGHDHQDVQTLDADVASGMADNNEDESESAERFVEPRPVPRPHKCEGKKDGFRFEWGAPHFCEPKDDKKCKDGEEGTTYEDCLAVDKYGNQYQTGLTRDVKCKVICNRQKHDDKDCEVPEPPKHKCYGKQHGFRFEWGAPHACVPKDGKKCKVGDKGVTYRDCLAIKKKTGEEFITSLNKEEPCKILSCPKHDHDHKNALWGWIETLVQ